MDLRVGSRGVGGSNFLKKMAVIKEQYFQWKARNRKGVCMYVCMCVCMSFEDRATSKYVKEREKNMYSTERKN